MLNLLYWAGVGEFDRVVAIGQEPFWLAVTIALSAIVFIAYAVIAINWYFQSKFARGAGSGATLKRLRNICLCCALCGTTFYLTDMPWFVWRFYDACLIVFAWSSWSFVWRMRGVGLVDERLAQVEELERAATFYREIAELLPHMVWTANAFGTVDFLNQRWRDYAGGDITWLEAVHPDERFRVLNTWNAAVAARLPVSFEARLNGRDGYRTFVIRATPIVQGDAIRWLGACADIEDQKLLAAEKEHQARQKSFFLNALSHDLRAPLHNVLLNAQLLKMSAAAGEPPDAEALAMIEENAVAAGDLVARLLDFARVGGQDQNVIEPVVLPDLLGAIARRFAPLAEQKGLYVRTADVSHDRGGGGAGDDVIDVNDVVNVTDGDDDTDVTDAAAVADAAGAAGVPGGDAAGSPVPTDRQKLDRIISNLVENAIKYTAHGGVVLEWTGSAHGQACVRVRDSGIGIPQDKVPYLFEEFYQVGNYERDRSKGFGMGLAICRSLARHIGADVRLASTGDGGSCFEIILGGGPASRGIGDAAGDAGARDRPGAAGGTAAAAATAPAAGGNEMLGPDRGGRPHGSPGDRNDPSAAGLCRV